MFEVKRPGISKGQAVSELMTYPPFADRQPIFIGDDVTDESVFAALPRLAGKGYSVGRPFRDVAAVFATPREVREALDNLAAKGRE
jgi:trehalose 6-phosphate phosphatase